MAALILSAVTKNNLDALRSILEKEASISKASLSDEINKSDNELQLNALQLASTIKDINPEVINLLVEYQGNINTKNQNGLTALHIGCKRQNWDACKILIEMKLNQCEINSKSNKNYIPLYYALKYQETRAERINIYEQVIVLLLDNLENFRTEEGNNILHISILFNNIPATKKILQKGVVPLELLNTKGESPLILALNNKNEIIAEILIKHSPTIILKEKEKILEILENNQFSNNIKDIILSEIEKSEEETRRTKRGSSFRGVGLESIKTRMGGWEGIKIKQRLGSKRKIIVSSQRFDNDNNFTIMRIFNDLDQFHQLSMKDHKKIKDAQNELTKMNDLLKIIITIVPIRETQIKWAWLFNKRITESKSLLSKENYEKYITIFKNYLLIMNENNNNFSVIANSLIEYLQSHIYDCDNCLIGLTTKNQKIEIIISNVLENILFHTTILLPDILSEINEIMYKSQITPFPDTIVFNVEKLEVYKLSNKILNLDTLNDSAKLQQIQSLNKYLRALDELNKIWHNKSLRKGDILISIFQLNKENDPHKLLPPAYDNQFDKKKINYQYRFLRYSGCSSSSSVSRTLSCFHKFNEFTSITVPIQFAVPFPEQWVPYLSSKKSISALIENPTDVLFVRLMHFIRDSTNQLMEEEKIDTVLLEKAITLSAEVTDSDKIRELKAKLTHLLDNLPESFIKRLEKIVEEETEKFIKFPPDLFVLHSTENLQESFAAIDVNKILFDRINRYIQYCNGAIEQIELKKNQVVNGIQKREITTWWLSVINVRVENFLQEKNYDFKAVKYNYIEQAPDDILIVRNNLRLIQEILDKNADIHNIHQLIAELKSIIYPKIDLFIENATATICEKLQIQKSEFTLELGFAELKKQKENAKILQEIPATTDEDYFYKIECLLKDIQYLFIIKKMEEDPGALTVEDQLNIVPISGLIMNCFYRLENELKTVLEVWDPAYRAKHNPFYLKSISSRNLKKSLEEKDSVHTNIHNNSNQPGNESGNETPVSIPTRSKSDFSISSKNESENNGVPLANFMDDEKVDIMISVDDILSNLQQTEMLTQYASQTRQHARERTKQPTTKTSWKSRLLTKIKK